MNREAILDHLGYGLAHVDGLRWLCEQLLAGIPIGPARIIVGNREMIARGTFAYIQNPIAESGLIYCRKLLEFLGIKLDRDGQVLYSRTSAPADGDVGIEHLGLQRVPATAIAAVPIAPEPELREACMHTLRSANKGVAHFTVDRGEQSSVPKILLCAKTVTWLVEKHVYKELQMGPPFYRVWTAG